MASFAYGRIYPPIGIARVGDSPDAFFVGPEVPGLAPDPGGSYKDEAGRVKRQAARFRVYAFDEYDRPVAELTADHPDVEAIEWTVALANKKASWHQFTGADNVASILAGAADVSPLRNLAVQGADRAALEITPPPATVSGRDQASAPLAGRFLTEPGEVVLGDLRTDGAGRLLVLGGHGRSDTVLPDNPLNHYANNDGWFDDTADGPVTAAVRLQGGGSLEVRGRAWVVVTPPDFSPHTQNVVTLFDVLTETAVEHDLAWPEEVFGPRPADADPVSFTRDIFPILRRLVSYQWVSDRARRGHSRGKPGDFLAPDVLPVLADPTKAGSATSPHARIFARLRTPILHSPVRGARPPRAWELDGASQDAIAQANLSFMPPLAGDEGDVTHGAPTTWLSLTSMQYRMLSRWKDGDFVGDWPGAAPEPAPSLDAIPVEEQPAALTRAALEPCQGGAFFPGIEMTSIARFPEQFAEAYRLADALGPGDVTRWMALPWQADFYECRDHWWPIARPDDVVPAEEYDRVVQGLPAEAAEGNVASLLVARRPWARGLALAIPARPGLPDPAAAANAAGYQALCRRQLDKFIRGFLRVVPPPMDGEVDGLYLRRATEFLDRTVASAGGFATPPLNPGEALADYYPRLLGAVRGFLVAETALPAPGPGEALAAYAGRLAEVSAKGLWQGLFDVEWQRRVRHQGKNDLVLSWGRLGFVVPRTAAGETVFVEADRGKYDLLGFRDYFYYVMNLEDHEDFLPRARQLADEYLRLARDLEPSLRADPNFEQYGNFAYDPITFQARLEKIYETERRSATVYNPATGEGEPLFRTAAQVMERIRQLAPFNQLDGSWLERAAHAGPIDEINSALFEIWSDEIGNGDPAQSHANVYGDLLHSAGIYLPPLASRAYADNPDIWDSSFSSPVYQTAIAHFPEAYFPELLGMTLYLEWEAIYLPAMVKLYEYHGYNSLFYRLHVAIDNPVNGHGARAREAVIRYLDHVREDGGESEVQAHWARIWNGYLAFKFIGGGDWQYYFTHPPTPEDRVLELIDRKKHYAQLNHGDRKLGPNFINDWFDEPGDFLNELISSDLITKGDAKNSRFFALTSFTGPMLKVFSAKERDVLADWINSLPPEPLGAALDPGASMVVLLRKLRPRAMAVPDHDGPELMGRFVDPARPDELNEVVKPISWWFRIDQPRRFMAALADVANGWIVPGDVANSRFVRELLAEPRRMSRFLIATIPELGNKSARQVIIDWIAAGCPIPADPPARLTAAVPAAAAVRMAVPPPENYRTDDYARQVQRGAEAAVRLTSEQTRGLRRRFYGPGGGAPH